MDENSTKGMAIFSGNSNPVLTKKICAYLILPMGNAKVKTFSDGEIQIEIDENVRSKDVFLVQSTCEPVNNNLVELLLMLDAFKRSSASRITAVIPYYGYARQDKKVAPRVPISAKLVADMLEVAGANRVITMDLHAGQIQGFFNIPVDNLFAAPVILEYIKSHFDNKLVIVSPDAGGAERARAFAKRLHADLAVVDKRRDAPNKARAMAVIGDVSGKVAIILDDMVDTAGTIAFAAGMMKSEGALSVRVVATHPVLSGPAYERIDQAPIDELIVTDTIPLKGKSDKIKVISVAEHFAEVIDKVYNFKSISDTYIR